MKKARRGAAFVVMCGVVGASKAPPSSGWQGMLYSGGFYALLAAILWMVFAK